MGLTTKGNIFSERVAVKIVDLARAGEFDPDKLTALALAHFDGRSRSSARAAAANIPHLPAR
jgi:hypothetical protein